MCGSRRRPPLSGCEVVRYSSLLLLKVPDPSHRNDRNPVVRAAQEIESWWGNADDGCTPSVVLQHQLLPDGRRIMRGDSGGPCIMARSLLFSETLLPASHLHP